jgi:hypothetical protein
MFDNVNYNVLERSTIDVLGGVCVSQCLTGTNDWIEASVQNNGKCRTIKYVNSPKCLPQTIAEKRVNREPYCSDETTLWSYDNLTAKYLSTTCQYRCYNNKCQTKEEYDTTKAAEAAAAASTGAMGPFGPSGANITGYLEQNGLGFVIIFLTPIFWVFMIAAGVGGYVGYKSKIPEIGLATMFGILIIAALPQFGIFPIWFLIVFIVIAGLVFGEFINKRFSNKN